MLLSLLIVSSQSSEETSTVAISGAIRDESPTTNVLAYDRPTNGVQKTGELACKCFAHILIVCNYLIIDSERALGRLPGGFLPGGRIPAEYCRGVILSVGFLPGRNTAG